MRRLLALFALSAAVSLPAVGQEAVPAPAGGERPVQLSLQAITATLPVRLRDSQGRTITIRMPRSLHRDANRFRLYGTRPLTLWSHSRRQDLYRDAFLELATQSRLTRPTTAWDSAAQQWNWLRSLNPELQRTTEALTTLQAPEKLRESVEQPIRSTTDALKALAAKPDYSQLATAVKALAGAEFKPEADPMLEAFQLRALATDEAERRLNLLGEAIGIHQPGTDPAMRAGYLAACDEFEQVRNGLWSALALSMKKNQGRLILSAAKQIVLSRLGWWALFGHLAWQGVESTLNAEYGGQYAVCLATLASRLAETCGATGDRNSATPRTAYLPLALYAEFAMNYQLTEALKSGQLLGLKPAGGRGVSAWQLQFSDRCAELRAALAPTLTQEALVR